METQVLLVNMMAGVFTALAAALLAAVCQTILRILFYRSSHSRWGKFRIAFASAVGALCFAWADSPWFSAVEAEVYAMSIFFTALCIWLMIKWALCPTINGRARWLILIGYVTGLSIGVHQLNLLCIPALALIFVLRRMPRRRAWLRGSVAILVSFVIVGCILAGMMPGIPWLAGMSEILFVNYLSMPYGSGVVAYLLILFGLAWGLPFVAFGAKGIAVPAVMAGLVLFLSGLTSPGGDFLLGGIVAVILAIACGLYFRRRRRWFQNAVWMLPMLLTGYGVYMLIPIRGYANPPMNDGHPGDPFSFYSYLQREQYGSSPLFYGRTPQSRPMLKEEFEIAESVDEDGKIKKDTVWKYSDYVRIDEGPKYMKVAPGAKITSRSGLLSSSQLQTADSLTRSGKAGYVMPSRRYRLMYTPELDMWFPRINSSNPDDIESYQAWVGMDTTNMERLEVSETLTADGLPEGKIGSDGLRHKRIAYRPTYWQALKMMLGYQFGYMYGRYHLWNFLGQQNDVSSTGEVDHGNFITGLDGVDDLMLGAQEKLPPELGAANRGRNIYFGLPLILGIVGVIFLCRRGKGGHRILAVILALFLMTGLAIVFYLNQGPGEPRERDYSFLGSYWAYAVLIGCGAGWLLSLCRKRWAKMGMGVLIAGVPLWMLAQNYDDHDRSDRHFTEAYGENLLNSLAPDAIFIVQGDNVSFPVWYAQHVKGVRPDVTIVSQTYMACPWYIEQLRIPTAGAPGIPFTMPRNLTQYGAHLHTKIDTSKGEAVGDGVEMLKQLYAGPDQGVLGYARLRLGKDKNGRDIILDLRPEKTGATSNWLSQSQLMMIDLLVSNQAQEHPRPVYWHSGLGWNSYIGAYPLTRRVFAARRFAPDSETDYLIDDVPDLTDRLVWGGIDKVGHYYIDEITALYAGRMRTDLLFLALAQEKEGCYKEALETFKEAWRVLPPERVPYVRKLTPDSIVDETEIVLGLAERLGRFDQEGLLPEIRKQVMHRDSLRGAAFTRYRRSLPPHLRQTLSPATRSVLPHPN